MADRTQHSSPQKKISNVHCREELLAYRLTHPGIRHFAWRCKHVSNISAGRKQLQISALPRRCWQLWQACTEYISDRQEENPSRKKFIISPAEFQNNWKKC